MASTLFPFLLFLLLLLLFFFIDIAIGSAQLQPGLYDRACPGAESAVREVVRQAMAREPRSAASVMRLQFHDCFVNVSVASYPFL